MTLVNMFPEFFFNLSVFQSLVATVFLLALFYYSYWQYRDVPPGPWGLPLLGYWPFLNKENAHMQCQKLKEKYGEVYSMSITGHLHVNLCSIKVIKEAHVSKSECFMGRFSDYSLLTFSFEDAVSIINGESWRVQRKFYAQKFKEYGLLAIKEKFSGSIYDTLKETVDEIRVMKGEPFQVADLLVMKCSKIIRRILFNDQGITEEELKELNEHYQPVLNSMTYKNTLLMGNIARYMVFPFLPSYWAMIRGHNHIQNILKNVINRHKENFDETQILDIIDSFYKEKRDRESKGDPTAKYFTDKSLRSSVYQFVTDGILTIAFFIGIFLEKLVQLPEEQEKIHEELLDVLGPDRQPTIDDKTNLPYTNAFIYEVIRTSDFFPAFPSLKCTKEMHLNGFRIPKGAITVLNIWCAHNDPSIYKDPFKFDPSRFLTVPGTPKPELPIMFGIGKRNCMGEPLVMMETFLFVATIVKNFKLAMPHVTSSNWQTVGDVKISARPRVQEKL